MAEGDTILRLARRIEPVMAGKEVIATAPGRRRGDGRPASTLNGRTLVRVQTRGKHLLLQFSGGLTVHSHLGMSGSWHLHREGERWRKPVHQAWIALTAAGHELANFGGSTLRIVRTAQLIHDPRLQRLGPDLLAPGFTEDEGIAALRSVDQSRELGEALLDQGVIAGIGNIFKSESCFAAQVDPWARLSELDDPALHAVVGAARRLMLAAVESGQRQTARVYRRKGRPCPRCRTSVISSLMQGDDARTTYWCPACQDGSARLPSAQQG